VRVKPIFRLRDFWIGVYVDKPNGRAYVFPIPCFGFRLEWRIEKPYGYPSFIPRSQPHVDLLNELRSKHRGLSCPCPICAEFRRG